MNNKNKNKRKEENPEILRENRQNNFDDDEIGITLFSRGAHFRAARFHQRKARD